MGDDTPESHKDSSVFWNRRLNNKAKVRTKLYKKARKTRNPQDYTAYCTLDSETKIVIRMSKQERKKLLTARKLTHPKKQMPIVK